MKVRAIFAKDAPPRGLGTYAAEHLFVVVEDNGDDRVFEHFSDDSEDAWHEIPLGAIRKLLKATANHG